MATAAGRQEMDSGITGYAGEMIVVVGQPIYRESAAGAVVDGVPARIALVAAAAGRSVQLVGKAGEDEEGDSVVLALSRGGVGHVALLREAGRSTPRAASAGDEAIDTGRRPGDGAVLEAADIELALRYLTEFSVLILADPVEADVMRVASAAAGWGESRIIVVLPYDGTEPEGLPADAIVFRAPQADPDGSFAATVGTFAAALDSGGDPRGAS